jgi:hypothetical protein
VEPLQRHQAGTQSQLTCCPAKKRTNCHNT